MWITRDFNFRQNPLVYKLFLSKPIKLEGYFVTEWVYEGGFNAGFPITDETALNIIGTHLDVDDEPFECNTTDDILTDLVWHIFDLPKHFISLGNSVVNFLRKNIKEDVLNKISFNNFDTHYILDSYKDGENNTFKEKVIRKINAKFGTPIFRSKFKWGVPYEVNKDIFYNYMTEKYNYKNEVNENVFNTVAESHYNPYLELGLKCDGKNNWELLVCIGEFKTNIYGTTEEDSIIKKDYIVRKEFNFNNELDVYKTVSNLLNLTNGKVNIGVLQTRKCTVSKKLDEIEKENDVISKLLETF